MGKSLNVISQFMHNIVQLTSGQPAEAIRGNESFQKSLLAIAELNDRIDALYRPDENGEYPKVKKEELDMIRNQYLDVYLSVEQLKNTVMQQMSADNEENALLFGTMDEFMDHMIRDFRALNSSLDAENKTLPELLSNQYGYRVNVSGEDFLMDQDEPDRRISMTFTDSTGKQVTGHFMRTVWEDEPEEDPLNSEMMSKVVKIARNAIEGYPEYKPAILALLNDDSFTNSISAPNFAVDYLVGLANEENINLFFRTKLASSVGTYLEEGQDKDEYLNEIMQDGTFVECVMKFIKEYAPVREKYDSLENAKITSFSNTEQRGAAVSTMAGALGVSGLVTQSVKMRTMQDGVETEGIFTSNSEHTDLFNLKEDDIAWKINDESIDNPAVLKDIAQLQMLDFICGNTTRQNSTTRFRFEEKNGKVVLSGIQGVDNDYTFGAFGPNKLPRFTTIVKSDNLLVISEEMAARIMAMKKETLEQLLKEHGLSDSEVDFAWQRTEHIQQAISEGKEYFKDHPEEKVSVGHLRVVKDNEWKDLHMEDLTFGKKFKDKIMNKNDNYFANYSDLPGFVKNLPEYKQNVQEKKEFYENKFPQLKKDAEVAPVEGVRLDELSDVVIRDNNARITDLGKKMLSANEGFFIGSTEFKNLMGSFRDTMGKVLVSKEAMTVGEMTALQESYQDLMDKTNTYLAKKEREERAMRRKGKTPSDNMEKRMNFARELKAFVDERLSKVDLLKDTVDQYKLAVAKKLTDGIGENEKNIPAAEGNKLSEADRNVFAKSVMDNDVFRTFVGGKTINDIKTLAGSPVNTIVDTINREASMTRQKPKQIGPQPSQMKKSQMEKGSI